MRGGQPVVGRALRTRASWGGWIGLGALRCPAGGRRRGRVNLVPQWHTDINIQAVHPKRTRSVCYNDVLVWTTYRGQK
jgi:hypothetical protein